MWLSSVPADFTVMWRLRMRSLPPSRQASPGPSFLVLLAEAELTVSDLTQILRQSQPRISRHLKLLVEAGLVERFREGAWAFFRLAEGSGSAAFARTLVEQLNPRDSMVARDH